MRNSTPQLFAASVFLVAVISSLVCEGAIVDIVTTIDGNKLNLASIELPTPGGAPNRIYSLDQLVRGTLVDYESIPEYASPGSTISVVATPDPAPEPGDSRLDYVFDAALNTGLLNISTASPGLTVVFDEPIVNHPGQEIVIFELTVGQGQSPDPLVIQSADGRGHSREFASSSYEFVGIIPAELTPWTYVADVGQGGACNLMELLSASLSPSAVTNPKFHALAVNLDTLGIPAGDSVQSLLIRSSSSDPFRAADILLVVGTQNVPEPPLAVLVVAVVMGAVLHRKLSRATHAKCLPTTR